MKKIHHVVAFGIFTCLAASAGCLTGTGKTGGGASSVLAPMIAPPSGAAGPGESSAADGGGDVGDISGDGANPPSPPPAGGEDRSTFGDTPMTIVGSPLGGDRKPKPCPTNFRLCFHDLTVAAKPSGTDGLLQYDISGILGTQQTAGGDVDGVALVFVYLIDLLFPDNERTTSTGKPLGDFVATVVSPPGRSLRFQHTYCKHKTTLDVVLPEESASPLVLDPCGGTEPTDVGPPSTGPSSHPIKFDGIFEMKAQ
jgi:hypothetical protein